MSNLYTVLSSVGSSNLYLYNLQFKILYNITIQWMECQEFFPANPLVASLGSFNRGINK